MSNSWEFLEEAKNIVSDSQLKVKDLDADWMSGEITFRCFDPVSIGELSQLATKFEAASLILKPEFNYNGAWNRVTIYVDPPGCSKR